MFYRTGLSGGVQQQVDFDEVDEEESFVAAAVPDAEPANKGSALPKLAIRSYFPETWLWDIVMVKYATLNTSGVGNTN